MPYGVTLLEPRGSRSESGTFQLDLQLGKAFELGRVRPKLYATVYNVLDSETAIAVCENFTGCGGFDMGDAIEWQRPRRYEFGVRVDF